MSGQASLLQILRGCLNPSSVHICEEELKKRSYSPTFVEDLLRLMPNQNEQTLQMILTNLKNLILQRYNSQQSPLLPNQKAIIRDELLRMFYVVHQHPKTIKLMKEIMHCVILVDFPWQGLKEELENDLNSRKIASVYFIRQVAKAFEYTINIEHRQAFEGFVEVYFPRLQALIQQILSSFNPATAVLLHEIMKTFYSTFHVVIPNYLRNFTHMESWMTYLLTILNAPSDPTLIPSQQMAARAYVKLFSLYCSDTQDDKSWKGWALHFAQNYIQKIFNHVLQLIGQKRGNQNIISSLVQCVYETVCKVDLRPLFTQEHSKGLFYCNCLLPMCQSTPEELKMFNDDPIQYVRRQQDLSCYPLRRSIMDLVELSASTLYYGDKSEMIRLVEFSASVLDKPESSEAECEVVTRVLIKIGKQLLANHHLRGQFQALTNNYFIPLLRRPSPIINSLTCELLSITLPLGDLDSGTVGVLMELIYERIVNVQSMVIKYHAIMAFTALLGHKAALQASQPHFSQILKIYVNIMNNFEHEQLIQCLEQMVRHFSNEVVTYAPDLLTHLLSMFKGLALKQQNDDEDEPDVKTPATAALSTLRQLINCQLGDGTFFNISGDFIDLLRGILGEYETFFDEILSLFNVLVYKSKQIKDYEYPYVLCRKLLEGNNQILEGSQCYPELLAEVRDAEKADSQFEQQLVSILKNLIQKMPMDILMRYRCPTHPELLLCMIENQKVPEGNLTSLDTSKVDNVWNPYLKSYCSLVYGVGELSHPQELKLIVGVSLFPWLKHGVTPELVRLVVNSIEKEEEEDQDDLDENTAQLLQRYGNEDDDEEYQEGEGTTYNFLYDSPFDDTKDRQMLINGLRNMSQQQAQEIVGVLPPKYRNKLEQLTSGQ